MPRDVQIHLRLDRPPPTAEAEHALRSLAANSVRCKPEDFACVRLLKVSLDARPRRRGWSLVLRTWEHGEDIPPLPSRTPPKIAPVSGGAPTVVVIGSGPAGLWCALDLVQAGVRAIVLERGPDVRERRRGLRRILRGEGVDGESNYCFGEGGAGTYSDGKLYTRSGNKRAIRRVLEDLVAHGAAPGILSSWRPHVGSNRLPEVVSALSESIRRAGGEVRLGARVEDFEVQAGRIRAVQVRDLKEDRVERLACDATVLATGHSAFDSLSMASRAGALLEPKGFAMGVRIEQPQAWLDERQYGGARAQHDLPAAFYELTTQVDGRGVYSFCMCPGGFIVPASTQDSRVVVNGMSLSRRDSPFANSGLVVALEPEDWCGARGEQWGWPQLLRRAAELGQGDLPEDGQLPETPADDPIFGVRLQLALETVNAHAGGGQQRAPAQRADLARAGHAQSISPGPTSYRPGLTEFDLGQVLPTGLWTRLQSALTTFEERMPGFAGTDSQLIGVESRTSSPTRIARDPESLEAVGVAGLYPCGEGAGFAGGIVSAALDGRRVATVLVRRLSNP